MEIERRHYFNPKDHQPHYEDAQENVPVWLVVVLVGGGLAFATNGIFHWDTLVSQAMSIAVNAMGAPFN